MSTHVITSEKGYLDLLSDVLQNGTFKEDRTGTGTYSVFGRQIRFDLSQGFPLLTTKKVFLKGIIHELLWMLKGSSNIKYLVDNGVHIWDDWPYRYYKQTLEKAGKSPLSMKEFILNVKESDAFAKEWGELGPVYGVQWRRWQALDGRVVDQIADVIEQLKKTPYSRRLIVSAWNAADIEEMTKSGLPPCHAFFQFYVTNNKLSCQLYIRSNDLFLGAPFNIASYALLTMMIAQVTGLEVGEYVHTLGDAHIYKNHVEQAKLQISRDMRPLPTMKINPNVKNIDDFTFEDFELIGYDPHPPIKAEVSV